MAVLLGCVTKDKLAAWLTTCVIAGLVLRLKLLSPL
jgi:hypothetical protein